MRIVSISISLLLFLLLSSKGFASDCFRSRYQKPPYEKSYKTTYGKERKKTEKWTKVKVADWTPFGKLVGEVDNLLIIKTKDGKYLLKPDWRK